MGVCATAVCFLNITQTGNFPLKCERKTWKNRRMYNGNLINNLDSNKKTCLSQEASVHVTLFYPSERHSHDQFDWMKRPHGSTTNATRLIARFHCDVVGHGSNLRRRPTQAQFLLSSVTLVVRRKETLRHFFLLLRKKDWHICLAAIRYRSLRRSSISGLLTRR